MSFSYKKLQDTFYIYKDKKVLRTPGDYDVTTQYENIAKKLVADLSKYGDDYTESESIYLYQCTYLDFYSRLPKEELLREMNRCFINVRNWTDSCPVTSRDEITKWLELFGLWRERKEIIKKWLENLSRMKLCAVCCLANAVKSIQIPYILNLITEGAAEDDLPAVKLAIKKFAEYVSNYRDTTAKGFYKEFILFYDFFTFESSGSNTITEKNKETQQYNKKDILSKDESKHIKCEYNEDQSLCTLDCSKCAIHQKSDGDKALLKEDFINAQKYYIAALKINPSFAEAWVNLGNAYGYQSKYDKALYAFDKAIEIDNIYGKALLGKAITLRNLNYTGAALIIFEHILQLYNDPQVRELKQELLDRCLNDFYTTAKDMGDHKNAVMVKILKDALEGQEEDLKTAIRIFRTIKDKNMLAYFIYLYAEKGSKDAQYSLSMMYYEKTITGTIAIKEALYWMTKAAEEGNPLATGALGYLYIKGSGTEDDIKKGLILTNKAAQEGDHDALETLGDCYYNGIGIAVNHENAKKYWLKSAGAGNKTAIENLKKHFDISYEVNKTEKEDDSDIIDDEYEIDVDDEEDVIDNDEDGDEEEDEDEEDDDELKSTKDFYIDTLKKFVKIATQEGLLDGSIIFVPEIVSEGQKYILKWLQNKKFSRQFGNDAIKLYYNIAMISLYGAAYYVYVWHTDYSSFLKEDIYDLLYARGVSETANTIFSIDKDIIRELGEQMYKKFVELIQPYHKSMDDYSKYIFEGMLAFFQIGASIQLKSMGFK